MKKLLLSIAILLVLVGGVDAFNITPIAIYPSCVQNVGFPCPVVDVGEGVLASSFYECVGEGNVVLMLKLLAADGRVVDSMRYTYYEDQCEINSVIWIADTLMPEGEGLYTIKVTYTTNGVSKTHSTKVRVGND